MSAPHIIDESHVDHLTPSALQWVELRLMDDEWPAGEVTVRQYDVRELGLGLRTALVGPACGDHEVEDDEVVMARRGDRAWLSRTLPRTGEAPARVATVVVGPHPGDPSALVLYTAYGGPPAPRKPGDPSLPESERAESEAFWAVHALATGGAS